jgi:cytochrome P450
MDEPAVQSLDEKAAWFLRDPLAHSHPYPFFAELRAQAPVFRMSSGAWMISKFDDVDTVLRDPRWSLRKALEGTIDEMVDSDSVAEIFGAGLKNDAPTHTRLRRLVSRSFTPRRVATWQSLIESVISELLDAAAEKGTFDIVQDYALPIPQRMICEMLGVPFDERDQFKAWSSAVTNRQFDGNTGDGRRVLTQAMEDFASYLRQLINGRRSTPGDDLLTELLAVGEVSETLSEIEIVALLIELIGAGTETTFNLIANTTWLLVSNPDELRKARTDPAMMALAIEESLRLEPPAHYPFPRMTTETTQLRGQTIMAGDLVFPLLSSANRDEDRYINPDAFIIDRADKGHISFASGPHFCLGAGLARVEGAAAVGSLFQRFPDLRLTDPEMKWRPHFRAHGPSEMNAAIS